LTLSPIPFLANGGADCLALTSARFERIQHGVWHRLALIVFIFALAVPRFAWATHEAGYDALSTIAAVHTHHAGHVDEHDGEPSAEHFADEGDGDDRSLTHDHRALHAVAAAMLPADAVMLTNWFASANMHFDISVAPAALSRPDSLLRPPRTA
jgi:hypothetical protein